MQLPKGRPSILRRDEGWPRVELHQHPDRHYQAERNDGKRRKFSAGVTGVTKDTENVDVIKDWCVNRAIDWARETGDFIKAKRAHKDALGEAGRFGTIVHNLIEAHLTGPDPFAPMDIAGAVSDGEPRKEEVQGALELWELWWKAQYVRRIIAIERPIGSEYWDYAGTPDLVFEDEMGLIHLCDWKTSKRIYGGYLLQAGAYMEAMMEFGLVVDMVQVLRLEPAKQRYEVYRATHPDLAWMRHRFLVCLAHWRTLQATQKRIKEGSQIVRLPKQ